MKTYDIPTIEIIEIVVEDVMTESFLGDEITFN